MCGMSKVELQRLQDKVNDLESRLRANVHGNLLEERKQAVLDKADEMIRMGYDPITYTEEQLSMMAKLVSHSLLDEGSRFTDYYIFSVEVSQSEAEEILGLYGISYKPYTCGCDMTRDCCGHSRSSGLRKLGTFPKSYLYTISHYANI
jgi:hypothetical protein